MESAGYQEPTSSPRLIRRPLVFDLKRCSRCKRVLDLEDFPNEKKGTLGKGGYCKQCRKEVNDSYLKKSKDLPEYVREKRKHAAHKRTQKWATKKYGVPYVPTEVRKRNPNYPEQARQAFKRFYLKKKAQPQEQSYEE